MAEEVKALEDAEIIRLYLERNEDAILHTQEKYGSRLRAVSYRITGDSGIAEECENDTYLEAWNRIPPSNPTDYFYAFLTKIVRAHSIDRCRENTRLKREGYLIEFTQELEMCIPAVGDVADDLEAKLLGEEISKYLYTLSDEKQVMFLRRHYYLDSVSEIARRLSVSESKVKTSLHRIRNGLREHLMKEGYSI